MRKIKTVKAFAVLDKKGEIDLELSAIFPTEVKAQKFQGGNRSIVPVTITYTP